MNRPKLFFEARMSADDAKVGNVYISGLGMGRTQRDERQTGATRA